LENSSYVVKTATAKDDHLLQLFFNNSLQYQLLLSKQLTIVAFNDCALKFHQTHTALLLEKGRSMLKYVTRSLAADFKNLCYKILPGDSVQYEHFIEGEWFYFTVTALCTADGNIQGFSIIGNNINNEKKNEKIIKQQSKYLSNIAWFQSHQLRHPVSSMLALINLVKEENDYHLTKEYLHHLETAALQLDDIIKKIAEQIREV